MDRFRLIVDGARPAALNMAVDEMLMQSVRLGGPPVLRFYSWQSPAVTVGYFEDVLKAATKFGCREKGMDVVRRITGGGAVLHANDLTFSLCLPVPSPYFASDVKSSYLKINEAVRMGLRGDYPCLDYADCKTVPASQSSRQSGSVCFEAPSCYDLLLEGKKVLGGSQRRTNGALLHQSTLFLKDAPEQAAEKIAEGFQKVWKITFEKKLLDAEEIKRASEAESKRRADASWGYFPEGSLPARPVGGREAIFLS